MDIRCLIGHDYGEIETSRDRRQRGNEVVVTVREYRECTRCGHQRVLSENKEVTADAGPDEADEPEAEAAWSDDEAKPTEPAGATFSRSPADEPLSAEEDDGIILEDEPTPPRARGEWPASEAEPAEAHEADPEPWPDADAPEAAPSAEVNDAESALDSAGEAPAAVSESAAEPSSRTPRPEPSDTELVCPECGETWRSANASLRPGDICPECRKGYLGEQVIQ